MNEREEWKPIPGWESYEMSTLARVRKITTSPGRFRKTGGMLKTKFSIETSGRTRAWTCLQQDKRKWSPTIGKLMLLTFVGPPPFAGAVTRHLDDNSTNNSLSNLAWGTTQQNVLDAVRNNRKPSGIRHPGAVTVPEDIKREIVASYKRGIPSRPGQTGTESALAKRFNLTPYIIRVIVAGTHWSDRTGSGQPLESTLFKMQAEKDARS